LAFIRFGNLAIGFVLEMLDVFVERHPSPFEYASPGFFVTFPTTRITPDIFVVAEGEIPICAILPPVMTVQVPARPHGSLFP
jgi:hypothetical protein